MSGVRWANKQGIFQKLSSHYSCHHCCAKGKKICLTLAFVAALLAVVQPIQAQIYYGCWSEKSAVFYENCLVAVTAIATKFLITPGGTEVLVPLSRETIRGVTARSK